MIDRSPEFYPTLTGRLQCHFDGKCVQSDCPDLAGSRTEAAGLGARENRYGSAKNPNTLLPLYLSPPPYHLKLTITASISFTTQQWVVQPPWWPVLARIVVLGKKEVSSVLMAILYRCSQLCGIEYALRRRAEGRRGDGRIRVEAKDAGKSRYFSISHRLDADLPIVPKQPIGLMKPLKRALKTCMLVKVRKLLSTRLCYR